jgi:hypothetical protein
MLPIFNFVSRDSDGSLNFVPRPSGGITNAQRVSGLALRSDNFGYVETLTSGAVPTTATKMSGMAFTQDGALYITTDAPTSASSRLDGLAIRADGAVHVVSNSATPAVKNDGAALSANGQLITTAPWVASEVLDIWFADIGITQADATERVSGWAPSLKGSDDLEQGTAAAQPILLPYAGVNYLWLPGVASNYASSPDSAALSITGDIDLRLRMAADDWTPSAAKALFYKYQSGAGNASYGLYLNTTGRLVFLWSADGSAAIEKTSTASPTVSDFGEIWVRAILDVDNGSTQNEVKFYTSPDGSTWTQLGATVTTAGVTSIFDSGTQISIGMNGNGTGDPLPGKIYRAQIYAGLTGTDLRFDANFTAVPEGSTTFTESSSNAATVTINSTGAKPARIIGSQQVLWDGSDDFLKTGAFTLDQPLTQIMVVKQVTWTSGDVFISGVDGTNECQIGQRNATPELQLYAGSLVAGNTGLAVATYGVVSAVFNGASSRLQVNLGTATTGDPGAQNMGAVTLGAASGGSQGFANMQVKAAAVCTGALSQSRLNQLIRAMAAQCGVSL